MRLPKFSPMPSSRPSVWLLGGALGLLLLVAGLVAGTGGRAPLAHALTNCDTTEAGVTPAEQQMVDLINGARAQVGLAALTLSPSLDRAAAWKSADPSAYGTDQVPFSHQDSLGRWPVPVTGYNGPLRPVDCGYPSPWGASENIAYGSADPQTIFNMWMGSAGHRWNINGTNLDGSVNPQYFALAQSYVVIGVGAHTFPGITTAWTTDFGDIDDSGSGSTLATTTPSPMATPSATATPSPTSTATPSPTPSPTPRPAVGASVTLVAGMNLVTYAGPEQPVLAALASVQDVVMSVYAWDSSTGTWLAFAPGLPGYAEGILSLKPGEAYYVQVSASALWTY